MTNLLTTHHLTKYFGKQRVLEDISFQVSAGDCLALIGPNGSGKTTLIRCLLGDLHPSSGSVHIKGKAPGEATSLSQVAFLPQANQIPAKLTVAELIAFFQEIATNPLSKQEIDDLLDFTSDQQQSLAEKLSGGQRRLLVFVLCLISQPEILILDEPTAGMDTSIRKRFWEIIAEVKKKGTTILYTSHYIEEVEHTADRLLVLHQGRLLRDTTPYAMRAEDKEKEVTLPMKYLSVIEKRTDCSQLVIKRDSFTFQTDDLSQVWHELGTLGCRIDEIEIQQKSLLDRLFEQTKEVEQ